jgi:AcrR family transcriptional regulator
MNRKGAETRQHLMDVAAGLFAARGVDAVTMAELHEASGQRNKSAVQYHFGSRDGLVLAIVRHHQRLADERRAELLDNADPNDLGELVAAFVRPSMLNMETESGRHYLRILPQLAGRFGLVDRLSGVGGLLGENLQSINALLTHVHENVRPIRLGAALDLLIESLAGRAGRIETDAGLWLDDATFVANLEAMIEGLLAAPLAGQVIVGVKPAA